MKRVLMVACIALGLAIGGCSSTAYLIKLKDGQTLEASEKPKLNMDTGYYEFKDEEEFTQEFKELY